MLNKAATIPVQKNNLASLGKLNMDVLAGLYASSTKAYDQLLEQHCLRLLHSEEARNTQMARQPFTSTHAFGEGDFGEGAGKKLLLYKHRNSHHHQKKCHPRDRGARRAVPDDQRRVHPGCSE